MRKKGRRKQVGRPANHRADEEKLTNEEDGWIQQTPLIGCPRQEELGSFM